MLGSVPRSKRNEASVFKPWRFEVLRTETASKSADSRKMLVVVSLTPEYDPPKTPAIHIGFSASAITKSSADSFLSTASKLTKGSFSFAYRTTTWLPAIFAASNARSEEHTSELQSRE